MAIVPLNNESLTPEFILRDALERDLDAVAIISMDKDGFVQAGWSCPTQKHLCALLAKFQAKVFSEMLE